MTGFSKFLIYLGIVISWIAVLLVTAKDENNIFYKLASKMLGHEPQNGDGAFHYPIGFLMMFILIVVFSILFIIIFQKYYETQPLTVIAVLSMPVILVILKLAFAH